MSQEACCCCCCCCLCMSLFVCLADVKHRHSTGEGGGSPRNDSIAFLEGGSLVHGKWRFFLFIVLVVISSTTIVQKTASDSTVTTPPTSLCAPLCWCVFVCVCVCLFLAAWQSGLLVRPPSHLQGHFRIAHLCQVHEAPGRVVVL